MLGGVSNSAIHRLCSLARKMKVETAIMEELPNDSEEIKKEYEALHAYFGSIGFKAYKGTFIAKKISHLEDIKNLNDKDFLASFIVINFKSKNSNGEEKWKSYLFKAICTIPLNIHHPKFGEIVLPNYYIHIYKKFKNNVTLSDGCKHEFNINGTFFSQQNSYTSVCAHSVLYMAINNMQSTPELITPEDINKILGINHTSSKIRGLTQKDLLKVLKQYDLDYTLQDFFLDPNVSYNDYIYNFIESGYPVLLVFTTKNTSHVVPILGHTLEPDSWAPEAEVVYANYFNLSVFKSSSDWVDHFIIHDDNIGMFLCLPVGNLKRITLPKYDPSFRAHYAVVIKPKKITIPVSEVEFAFKIIIEKLRDKISKTSVDVWTERIFERIDTKKPIIMRTFLVKKEEYKKHLEEKDFSGQRFSEEEKTEIIKGLPNIFWLSEITLPELYTVNKTKIMDFIYPACKYSPTEDLKEVFKRWIQIRIPFALFKRTADSKFSPLEPLSVGSHYPLLYKGTGC